MLDIRGTKTEENIEKDICEKAKLSVRLRLYGRQAANFTSTFPSTSGTVTMPKNSKA